jgi:hypothetical protein
MKYISIFMTTLVRRLEFLHHPDDILAKIIEMPLVYHIDQYFNTPGHRDLRIIRTEHIVN